MFNRRTTFHSFLEVEVEWPFYEGRCVVLLNKNLSEEHRFREVGVSYPKTHRVTTSLSPPGKDS